MHTQIKSFGITSADFFSWQPQFSCNSYSVILRSNSLFEVLVFCRSQAGVVTPRVWHRARNNSYSPGKISERDLYSWLQQGLMITVVRRLQWQRQPATDKNKLLIDVTFPILVAPKDDIAAIAAVSQLPAVVIRWTRLLGIINHFHTETCK